MKASKKIPLLIYAFVFLICITLLFWRTQTNKWERHSAALDLMEQIKRYNRVLNQEILEAKSGILSNYDSLVATNQTIQKLTAELAQNIKASNLDSKEDLAVQELFNTIEKTRKAKQELTEIFKAKNARLKNSLYYLPYLYLLIEDWHKKNHALMTNEYHELLAHTLSKTLEYYIFPTYEIKLELNAISLHFSNLSANATSKGISNQIDEYKLHQDIILKLSAEINTNIQEIINLQVDTNLDKLKSDYISYYLKSEKTAFYFRIFLFIITVTLTGYITLLFYQLRKANVNLKSANQELEARIVIEDELKATIKSLEQSAIIAYTDIRGKITYVNNKFVELSGYSRDELIGSDHRIINSGLHSKEFFKQMWTQILAGQIWVGETRNKAKDGSYYWVQTIINPILDRAGNIQKFMSVRFDITQSKSNEFKLLEQQEQLIESARMATLGEMAGGIAHEINNPVSIIKGKAIMLLKHLNENRFTPERGLQDLDRIIFAADRIVKIVNGLRTFSRNGETDPYEKIQLQNFLTDVLSLCSEKFKNHAVKIEICPIPEVIFECRIVQLGQVILNLLNNSYDAVIDLPKKWVRIEVSLTEEKLQIAIVDSGSGIPFAIADKLMQPFFTTKSVGKGTGLGLSLSKGIVEEHSGTLKIDHSSTNTKFVIEIPILQNIANKKSA